MSKTVQSLLLSLLGAAAFAGFASGARANDWQQTCYGCGPQPTQYRYHDVYPHSDVFHHLNQYQHYPVYIPRMTVYETRVHPSVTVHNLVTIHREPYPVIVDHSKYETVTVTATYKVETVTQVVQEPCRCWSPGCKQ